MMHRICKTIKMNYDKNAVYYVEYDEGNSRLKLSQSSPYKWCDENPKIRDIATFDGVSRSDYIKLLEWSWNFKKNIIHIYNDFWDRIIFISRKL